MVIGQVAPRSFLQNDLQDLFCNLKRKSNILFTIQKNNRIDWINAWAKHYTELHQVDHIIIFDNNSTCYTLCELSDALKKFPISIYPLPFKYGPSGGRFGFEHQWLQDVSLQLVRVCGLTGSCDTNILNVDIDELIYTADDKSFFQKYEELNVGYATFHGLNFCPKLSSNKSYFCDYQANGFPFELLSNLVFGRLSSGFPLWLVSRFHPVYKSDPGNHLGQEIESSQSTPVLLGTLCELEHHMQHPLVG